MYIYDATNDSPSQCLKTASVIERLSHSQTIVAMILKGRESSNIADTLSEILKKSVKLPSYSEVLKRE